MSLIRCSRRSLVSSSEHLSWAAIDSESFHQKWPGVSPACRAERKEEQVEQGIQGFRCSNYISNFW